MKRVDYDERQHRNYARGRAQTPRQMEAWLSAFAAVLPGRRPLTGLDVGSGTGRFTPALARTFGPVSGIEPSIRMREVAQAESRHPDVQYLAGAAEEMPVPSESADYALLFMSWHHVQGKPQAVRELARVLKPGGRLLLRAQFSDHMPKLWWLQHFPRGLEIDAAMYQPLHEAIAMFTSSGWRVADFAMISAPSGHTRAQTLERLRLGANSVLEHFTPEELEVGFRDLELAVAENPDALVPEHLSPLLTFERC